MATPHRRWRMLADPRRRDADRTPVTPGHPLRERTGLHCRRQGCLLRICLGSIDHSFWPGDQLSWSNLSGGQRQRLTSLFCAEGDPCFVEGVGSPESAFPAIGSHAVLFSRLGGTLCLVTTSAGGFCNSVIPVVPSGIDWRSTPAA